MIADESSRVYKDRIFTVLNEIDQKVDKVKKKGIVFVGLSRVGKSTAYNWAIKHPLEAKTEQISRPTVEKKVQVAVSSTGRKRRNNGEGDILGQSQQPLTSSTVTYAPKIIQNETGQVRSGIKSCTLIPNIVDLDEYTSLLDMAGYGDSRDYVGTLGVSYSLRAIFQVLEEVKFIVVVTEAILKNFKLLSDTLNHFFGMFDLQKYPEIEERVFDATSLLITQSVDYMKYFDLIKEAKNQLEDPQLKNIDNRELIADFLDYISKEKNRFREFKMARLGQSPEQCNILQQFDKKGWKYMNLKLTREQVMKNPQDPDIIKLPFQKQFLSMKPSDQQTLMTCIDKRLKSYRTLSIIFANFYEKIFAEGSTNDIKLPYGSFLADIKTFVTENDHYDSEQYIPSQFLLVSQFIKPQKETLFYLLLKVRNIVNFDDSVLGSSKKLLRPTMDLFRVRITELVQLISVIFCRNRDDYRLMLQLRFILRGIREFYMLLHVSYEKVSSCVNEIHDNFQIIFPPDYRDYWSKFLLSFQLNHEERIDFGPKKLQNYTERYIQTRENAFALEILFKTHQYDIMTLNSQVLDQYYQILRDVKLIHARHQFQKYEYRKCLIYLYEAITLQTSFQKNFMKRIKGQLQYCAKRAKVQLQDSPLLNYPERDWQQRQKHLSQRGIMEKIMYVNQENIYQMLKQTYIRMKQFQTALKISKELNWVHSACEIYDIILAEKSKANKEIIQEYAIYCMDLGLVEKGRALFHRLLELQKTYEKKQEILKKIQFYVQSSNNSTLAYLKFLTHQFFLGLNDQKREDLLTTIGRSFKDENHNIDKIIDIIKLQFNNPSINQEQILQHQILIKYLSERDNSQAFCAANGFRANYNELADNIPTIVIRNDKELKALNIWLIQHLETVSKLSKNSLNGKRLRIEVKQIDSLSISAKHIIITLDALQSKKTFEYAVRLMKAIKKLIYEQHDKLLVVIKLALEALQKTDTEIREQLLAEYGDSITKEEIQAIKAIIQKMPKVNNEGIEAEYKKLYKQPKLVRSEMVSIFDFIRQKTCEELYEEVKGKMIQVSSNKVEMDSTRDYY